MAQAQRVVLVSGAARGIGLATAQELVRQGYAVALCDLREGLVKKEAQRLRGPGKAAGIPLDVTDNRSVRAAVRTCERLLGPVDVLVSNAGWDRFVPFVQSGEPLWRKLLEINFLGALRLTRQVFPGMVERRYGRIVLVSSDAARVGSSWEAPYAGAKAGLLGFAKTIAREGAHYGVTANVVCPGPTRTPLLEGLARGSGERLVDALERAVPMRRLGRPEEVAWAISFFASERSAYITGQTLSVSGGLTMV